MNRPNVRMRATLIGCICTIFAASALAGCKDTDVLKDVLYDQSANIEETNTDLAVWKYDKNSDNTSDQLPETDAKKSETPTNSMIPRALYSSKAGKDYVASQFDYSQSANHDCESTGTVKYTSSNNASKNEHAVSQNNKAGSTSDNTGQGGKENSNTSAKGDNQSNNSDKYENKNTDSGAGGGGNTAVNKPGSGGGDSDSGGGSGGGSTKDLKHYDGNSDYGEVPSYDTVAAYGPIAVIVQMVTGGGALVASNEDLLNGNDGIDGGFKTVFSDERASDVATVWSGDGTDSAKQLDIDALIKAKPDTIFLNSSSELSSAQIKRLDKAGIDYTIIPSLDSSEDIVNAVKLIAQMLESSSKKSADVDPEQIADKYADEVNSIIGTIESANGGYTAHKGKVLDDDADDDVSSANTKYTLLIDGWNTTATYTGSFLGYTVKADDGVGLATTGYKSSPVSYYMGVGGAVNVAAVLNWSNSDLNKKALVWQFGYNELNPNAWSSNPGITLARTGSGVKYLLNIPIAAYGGSNTNNTVSVSKSDGLGSDDYPAVIVTTQKMKTEFVTDALRTDGLYHPYSATTSGNVTFVGKTVSGQPLYSFIGQYSNGTKSKLEDAAKNEIEKLVLVNPTGMCCNWTAGTPESVLESAWVASCSAFKDNPTVDSGELRTYISDFYKEFYRYDLSDTEIDDILAGEEK